MSTLSGQTIQNTYDGLLKLEDSTVGINSGEQYVTDGLGNNTGLRIGQDFFSPVFGYSHYPMSEPNDYYGIGIGSAQATYNASQNNGKTVIYFYDRGVDSYSAVTWNGWTPGDANDSIDFAFYKMDFIDPYGYVPTEKISDVYTWTGITAGFKTIVLPSNLTFSGTGAGIYCLVFVLKTTDATFTARLTNSSYTVSNLNSIFGGMLGYVKNSLNNGAPFWYQTNSTSLIVSYTLSGDTLPSTLTSSNYPPVYYQASGTYPGFLLDTVK